jgi:hypothetical protein
MAKGGARPGAGRKRKTETESQETMRELVRSIVTDDDLQGVTTTAIALAKSGDDAARRWISSYCLGQPKETKDINLSGGVIINLPQRKKGDE